MINREDMLELTRRMTPERTCFDRIAGAYVIGLETNSEKASMAAYDELVGKPLYRDGKYLEMIENVTVSDIIEVANKYFNDVYVMSTVGL